MYISPNPPFLPRDMLLLKFSSFLAMSLVVEKVAVSYPKN